MHTDRKTYIKYDNRSHLLYLNEREVNWILPQHVNDSEQVELSGFAYTGDMPDGSTIVEVKEVTEENRRDKYIAGLINKRYSIDTQIAILANGDDTERHAQELRDFAAFRAQCKRDIDELLSR